MSSVPDDFSADDDVIETAAAEWLLEREEGFGPGRAAAFEAWCAVPRHLVVLRRTERTLGLLAQLPAVRAPLADRLATREAQPRVIPWRPSSWAAGMAALLLLCGLAWWFARTDGAGGRHFATAATRQQQVALVDGSVLNLNVSTDVRVDLSRAARRVTLTTGEAHFAVAPDPGRPFIVTAGDVAVRAVGTAFSVRLGPGGVDVLVTEGKVEVTRLAKGSSPATALPAGREHLVAGERTFVTHAAAGPAAVEQVAPEALLAAVRWHSPMMTFSDLPLQDAVALFNRRNTRQLVLADPALGARRIGGTFAADQVEAFVRLLVQDGDVAVARRSDAEIVLRAAP